MRKYYSEDDYLYEVEKTIAFKHGKSISETLNIMYPLSWYVRTGRASAGFVKAMYNVKPFVMARLLVRGYDHGSHDDVVRSIRKKVMGDENLY